MLVIDPESFRQQQSPRGIEDADPYNEKSLPPVGEGGRAKRGRMRGSPACTTHVWVIAAKPPLIRPLATFSLGGRLFYFHILIIPNALATELARMTAAKIGQSQRIMKRNTFLRRKG